MRLDQTGSWMKNQIGSHIKHFYRLIFFDWDLGVPGLLVLIWLVDFVVNAWCALIMCYTKFSSKLYIMSRA